VLDPFSAAYFDEVHSDVLNGPLDDLGALAMPFILYGI